MYGGGLRGETNNIIIKIIILLVIYIILYIKKIIIFFVQYQFKNIFKANNVELIYAWVCQKWVCQHAKCLLLNF